MKKVLLLIITDRRQSSITYTSYNHWKKTTVFKNYCVACSSAFCLTCTFVLSLSLSQYQCQVTHPYFSSIYIPVWSRRAWQGQLHRWCCCQGWPQRASSGWLSEPSYLVVTDSLLPAKLITTPCLLLMLISEDCIIFQHTGTKSWDYLKSKDKIQLYSWYVCCLEMSLLEGQSQKSMQQ